MSSTASLIGSSTSISAMASSPRAARPRLKVGDVDLLVAEQRAEPADEARLVLVGDVEHVRAEAGFEVDALDLDDARLAVGEHRAGDRALLPLGLHRQADVGLVGAALRLAHLVDLHAALARHDRRVDHVDLGQDRAKQAGEQRRGQRLGVHVGDVAGILDGDAEDRRLGELAGERAEVLGELDERRQPRRFLGRDRRHVERVGDGAADQVVGHLLGDLDGDVLLRLGGRGAEMRRAHDVGQAEQRARLGRLGDEHVDAGAGDLAGLERRGEVFLDHQAAAGAIDDAHAVLHLGDRRRVDDVPASSRSAACAA